MSIVSSSYLKWECSELIIAMTSLHILHKKRIWYVCALSKYVLYISWMYVDFKYIMSNCMYLVLYSMHCINSFATTLRQNSSAECIFCKHKKEHGINSVLTSSKLHFGKSWLF